ncbi:MAG: DUF6106 family protein [Ruminococcus flavefaciens]|nr:DUF6106 family protein [Ruminococcus flavefaciens]MCM1229343.1 DUF6106 family protein [Ruminococcus flavefaciens]
MDNFAEQLVKKQPTKSDRTKHIIALVIGMGLVLFFVATSILTIGSGGLFGFLGIILAVFTGIMTFISHRNTQVEYEYTFTNGDLDIDKIIAQSKRKEMISTQVSKFTAFGKYDLSVPEETADMTVVYASDNIMSHEYYADFQHEEYGNTRLVFCPDERMLSNINNCLPRQLKKGV